MPEDAKAPEEFPKFVTPDASHVVSLSDGRKIAPLFPDSHVNRDTGAITVLVQDAAHEAFATSPAPAPEAPPIAEEPASEHPAFAAAVIAPVILPEPEADHVAEDAPEPAPAPETDDIKGKLKLPKTIQ